MLTFLGLVTVIAIGVVFGVVTISLGGLGFLLLYGDIIVCSLIIAWCAKRILQRNGWFVKGKH